MTKTYAKHFGSFVGILSLASIVMSTQTACAPTVQAQKQVSARNQLAARTKRVYVLGFEGKYAKEVNVAFESMLVNHKYEGQPYFTVADRALSDTIYKEYSSALRGEIDPSTATSFGKKVGVSGIYAGDITGANIGSERVKRSESYCKRYKDDGKKCAERGSRQITCTERTAMLTLVPRLIDVETGQVIYRAEHPASASAVACKGDNLPPNAELLSSAIDQAIRNIRFDIAPNSVAVQVKIMTKPRSLNPQDTLDFESAVKFTKGNRMDRACQIWRNVYDRAGDRDMALTYNVALCNELDGQLTDALRMYRQVDNSLTAPDQKVSDALSRVQTTLDTKRNQRR